MRETFQTRLFHWKNQSLTIIFWLLLPIIGTVLMVHIADMIKEDAKVPIGIVLEENTRASLDLVDSIDNSSLIQVFTLSKKEAMYRLEKHELDSVFIIPHDYGQKIRDHNRHQLLTSYYTDLSFAYPTIKETIVSLVQQETGRSKAAQVVQSLADQYGNNNPWTWDEIVSKSKTIQTEQDLLHTSFSFHKSDQYQVEHSNPNVLDVWSIWAIIALLSTFLLFDWPSKESHSRLRIRFPFMKRPMKQYLVLNLLVYMTVFIIIDLITIGVFYYLFNEQVNLYQIGVIVTYRIMLTQAAFLLSLCFKRVYSYYLLSFVLFLLLAIGSGVILPLDGFIKYFRIITWINPLHAFIANKITFQWLFTFTILITCWYIRKEKYHASC